MDEEIHSKEPGPGGQEGKVGAGAGDFASTQDSAAGGLDAAQVESNNRENPEGHTGQHRHIRIMPERGGQDRNGPAAQEPPPPASAEAPPQALRPHKVRPDLRREELVKGSHPGDRYIRYDTAGPFRRRGSVLQASTEADQARSGFGKAFNQVKRTLIGRPISTERSIHERLTKAKALAVLSSDPLSSVAYATEEILRVLLVLGVTAMTTYSLGIGLAVILLLAIVAAS